MESTDGQKWGVGWGKRHRCPLIQPTCYCSNPWERTNRALHPPLSVGTLSVWAFPLTSSGCQCVGVSPEDILVPCAKTRVLSSASLYRYKQGSKVLKDRQCGSQMSTLERLRGPGPAMLCCLILDKLMVFSGLFSISHQQELTMDGFSQL